MESTPIKGEKLTAWNVVPGGTEVSLDFVAIDGGKHRIVLPVDTLSGLLMTLPRMLQSALDERFPDGSFRVVQGLGNWQLERPPEASRCAPRCGPTRSRRPSSRWSRSRVGRCMSGVWTVWTARR